MVAIKKHSGILAILLVFIAMGILLIYIATKIEEPIALYGFGGFVLVFSLFAFFYTIPSSFLYYYKQEVTKKYGSYALANIIHKEIEDHSYQETIDNRVDYIEEFHYILTYSFEYNGMRYENSFHVASKICFQALSVGAAIPIKFLRTNPKKSSVRRVKLSKELGLKKEQCL